MSTTPYANSVFEQPWWLDIVAPGAWREAFVRGESGEVLARMPYVYEKRWYGGCVHMPPLTQTLGPWIRDREQQPGNRQFKEQKEILAELLQSIPATRRFSYTLDSSNAYVLPYRWNGFRMEPTFSYRLTDLTDMEQVYRNFHKTAQKNIKRSSKQVTIDTSTDIDALYRMLEITFAHQNRRYPYSKELIARIVSGAEKHHAGKMFLARDTDGNVHAASYMVYDQNVAYALLGGSDPAYRTSGAKSLVWWHEIQFAAQVSRAFDFEGSMIEGIENFVRQFGGTPIVNYHITRNIIAFDMMELFKMPVKRLLGYKI